jgi:FKBP-type peptidyl-prolyl cis-trans isomerase
MATPKSQRIIIWVIAGVMAIGSVGTYFLIVLENDQAQKDQETQNALTKQLQDQQAAEDAKPKVALPGYEATAFDPAAVSSLNVETLVEGTGTVATADSTVTANYFGWTADGKIFDSTNKSGTVTPIDFPLNQVIKGWTQGLTGVKAGSTVRLSIPTDLAYGADAAAQGKPAGPLVFIIQVTAVK